MIFLIFITKVSMAELIFKPYLGLGQSSIALGEGGLIKGNIQGYLLGLRVGQPIIGSFYIALDYSRGGPYEYTIIDKNLSATYPKTIFNIFSGGAGFGIDGSTLTFWYGVYPYHVINEYNLDFSMKGTLTRVGLGLRVGREMELQFFSDSSEVKGDSLSFNARQIICNYASPCEETGKYSSVTFALGAQF